ncbi:MAG: DNA polymerase III subunit chi, partial [Acetobacteraceae bacterium]
VLTRIDFYVTDAAGALARERLACRIAAKAAGLGHRLHIHLATESALEQMDELLWTFGDTSFLPHARLGADEAVPVTLDIAAAPEPAPALLINLADEIPGFFSHFDRVAEIVSGDARVRTSGREHFRFYRDRGYPLQHHVL